MKCHQIYWFFAFLTFTGFSRDDTGNNSDGSPTNNPSNPIENTNPPNILLIIADDMGLVFLIPAIVIAL